MKVRVENDDGMKFTIVFAYYRLTNVFNLIEIMYTHPILFTNMAVYILTLN